MNYHDVRMVVDSVEKYHKDYKVDELFFLELLSDPGFIKKVRYKDPIGLPWGEWDRVSTLLEKMAIEIGFLSKEKISQTITVNNVVNYAYVFSNFFSENIYLLIDYLGNLSVSDILIIVSKYNISQALVKFILLNSVSVNLFSPDVFLILLMRSCTLRTIPPKKEKELILNYLSTMASRESSLISSTVGKALLHRANLLPASNDLYSKEADRISTNRTALFVSGQMRNVESSLTSLKNFLMSSDHNFDVYISTWEDVGGLVVHPSKLNRSVDSDVVNYLIKNDIDTDFFSKKISDKRRENFGKINRDYILDFLGDCVGSLEINIKNENEYPYNSMLNPEKMYYHNAYWLKTLGADHFINRYSHALKLRPDLKIHEPDLDIKECSFLITEEFEGWIFREWGFGIGDQVLYGDMHTMSIVLDTHSGCDLADDIVTRVFKKKGQQGHMNIGICAWLHCLNVINNKNFQHTLINTKKITMQELTLWGMV